MIEKMASDAETRINLTALKHRDPYISNITDSATQVAVYTFSHSSCEWEKTEIEGTLFVYSRIAPPYTGFTIMNRLKKETLTEPLTSDIEFQNQSPFLLYRNAKLHIYGIWFYDMYDCNRIGKLLVDQCHEITKKSTGNAANVPRAPNILNLPLSSSTGSSNASSVSDNALDDEVLCNNETAANNSQRVQHQQPSINLMDILCKAKNAYDKKHTTANDECKPVQGVTGGGRPATDLFKPIHSEKSRKMNVESLFESCDNQKNGNKAARPSSAELFSKILSDKGVVNEHQSRRRAARSLSLSLGTAQPLSAANMNSQNLVNGAISVVELESPVLGGSSSGRTRYHSVSGPPSRNASFQRVPGEEDSVLNKLLNKMAISGRTKNECNTSPAHHLQPNIAMDNGDVLKQEGPVQTNFLHRSVTSRNYAGHTLHGDKDVPNLVSSSLSPSFNTSPALPVVHEQGEVPVRTINKSMSVASGLAKMNSDSHLSPSRVMALHGSSSASNVKLLSPDVLRTGLPVGPVPGTLHETDNPDVLSVAKHDVGGNNRETSTENNQLPDSSKVMTLISPDDFKCSTSLPQKADELHQRLLQNKPRVDQKSTSLQSAPLDKQKLAETLINLLQTDNAFLSAIHNAYLSGLENSATTDQNSTFKMLPPLWK